MTSELSIETARPDQAGEVAAMVGELLTEIMDSAGVKAFRFDPEQTRVRLEDALARGTYTVFVALAGTRIVGFATVFESFALYAEGAFGTIPEFYVRPEYRSGGVGRRLLERVGDYGRARGWKRLEVTTPPLPAFERTFAFYQREGFSVAGGRKLKANL